MIKLITSAVLALVAALAFIPPAYAAHKHASEKELNVPLTPPLPGANSAKEVAQAIERALKKEGKGPKKGNLHLYEKECIQSGMCATTAIYFAEIKRLHPGSKLNAIEDLPVYLQNLVCHQPEPDTLVSVDRLLKSNHQVNPEDRVRKVHPGEYGCYDSNDGEDLIFLSDCGNVGVVQKSAPPPMVSVTVAPPPVKSDCFGYPIDGRNNPNVAMPVDVVLSFYKHSAADLHKLMADSCFYAEDDKTHERLRLDKGCRICEGEMQMYWPPDVADNEKETDYIFTVYNREGTVAGFPSGSGVVYVPSWFAASLMTCFTAIERYGYLNFSGYADEATLEDFKQSLVGGSKLFPRTLVPHPLGQGN